MPSTGGASHIAKQLPTTWNTVLPRPQESYRLTPEQEAQRREEYRLHYTGPYQGCGQASNAVSRVMTAAETDAAYEATKRAFEEGTNGR